MARLPAEWLDIDRYPFRFSMTTRFADIDLNNHINNVAMAAVCEDARVRFEASIGMVHGSQDDVRTMIVANDMVYLAEAHYPDPIEMRVGVVEIGRTSWTLACLAVQADEVRAFSRAVNVMTRDRRPTPLPETVRAQLQRGMLRPVIPAAGGIPR